MPAVPGLASVASAGTAFEIASSASVAATLLVVAVAGSCSPSSGVSCTGRNLAYRAYSEASAGRDCADTCFQS